MTFAPTVSDFTLVFVLLLYGGIGLLIVTAIVTTLPRITRWRKLVRWLLGLPLLLASAPVTLLLGDAAAESIGLSVPDDWMALDGLGPPVAMCTAFGIVILWFLWGQRWVPRISAPAGNLPPWPEPQLMAALAQAPLADARIEIKNRGRVRIDVEMATILTTCVVLDDRWQPACVLRFELKLDVRRHRVRVTETLNRSFVRSVEGSRHDPRWLLDLAREMKRPSDQLKQMVADAGWDWQPVYDNVPWKLRQLRPE